MRIISALVPAFFATAFVACSSSDSTPAAPATPTDTDAGSSTDAAIVPSDSRATLLVDGVAYAVDTTKVKVDLNDPTQVITSIGEPFDLDPAAKIGQVTFGGFRANATPPYSFTVRIPGLTKNNAYIFSTSGNFDDGKATRTIHGTLTDVHVTFTATALQDAKVSHAFEVTMKDLDMK